MKNESKGYLKMEDEKVNIDYVISELKIIYVKLKERREKGGNE